jgi:hypothetical protein
MLGFRVQLGTNQNNDGREPNPKHECNDGAEGTVCFVVVTEILRVPREQYRNDEPRDRCDRAAPCDPPPLRFLAAWAISIENREGQGNYNKAGQRAILITISVAPPSPMTFNKIGTTTRTPIATNAKTIADTVNVSDMVFSQMKLRFSGSL